MMPDPSRYAEGLKTAYEEAKAAAIPAPRKKGAKHA